MQTKLHINLTQGIIDVEGDAELVKAVYEDFKDRIAGSDAAFRPLAEQQAETSTKDVPNDAKKPKRRPPARKKVNTIEGDVAAVSAETPKLDKTVDTSSLEAFYDQYEPGSAPEKILIFLKYLIDNAGIDNPNTDQVFTCFRALKMKVPVAYAQAFRDASSKRGFIDLKSATDIKITIIGDNHFSHGLKKKGGAE